MTIGGQDLVSGNTDYWIVAVELIRDIVPDDVEWTDDLDCNFS
jgi:hypothetical protein